MFCWLWLAAYMADNDEREEPDERHRISLAGLDPREALKALLAVDPESEPVERDPPPDKRERDEPADRRA